nr:MAG TPA: hypothetical protein [Caudoviricetes sp.]DAX23364.1 MAG TPA: hypothetical protein [Caudoviricetes sp.]
MKFVRLSLQQKSGEIRIFFNAINDLHEIFRGFEPPRICSIKF